MTIKIAKCLDWLALFYSILVERGLPFAAPSTLNFNNPKKEWETTSPAYRPQGNHHLNHATELWRIMSTIGIWDSNQNPFTNLNSNQIRKSWKDYILTLKIFSFLSFLATQRITYGISLQSTKLLHERDWPSKRKPYHLTMPGYTKPIHTHRGNNSHMPYEKSQWRKRWSIDPCSLLYKTQVSEITSDEKPHLLICCRQLPCHHQPTKSLHTRRIKAKSNARAREAICWRCL